MLKHLKFHNIFCTVQSKRSETLNPFTLLIRYCHFQSEPGFNSSSPTSCLPPQKIAEIAIFWDLDTKPPKSVSPYEAAVKLKTAASSFRLVRHMIAYANRHALDYVPQVVRERKERNRVVIRDGELNVCRVCGRRFYTNEKLLNHFKIHEKEHMKRLSRIESARGSRRVKLVGKYSMKMEKYKNAARDVLTPKAGRGLADEVKRAGFWVRSVVDKPQRADAALRNHIVDMMDHRRAECLMLVSDDLDFVDVVMEVKLRCLKTVVMGDFGYGALKKVADSGFSWNEILIGKANKEAVSVVHNWDDEIDGESEEEEIEGIVGGGVNDNLGKDDSGRWWEIEFDDISKGDGSNDLEFLCSAWPDRLEVQKVYVLHHDRMPAKPYMGPDFESLKRTIQKRFID